MRFSARRQYSSPRRSPAKAIFSLILLLLVAAVAVRGFLLFKDSRIGKFDRFNVVIIAQPTTLVSVNAKDQTAIAVALPDELYISDLAYGYGAYRTAMIYPVGQLDRRGGETVATTVSDYLGVPVDGYIYAPAAKVSDLKSYFLSPKSVLGAGSSLNILDRLQLAVTIIQMRPDKIKTVNLGDFSDQLVLSDGSVALSLDKESADAHFQDDFVESRLRDEGFRLEMLNSTPVLGLGNRASRILVNIGANVVNVGTIDGQLPGCLIKTTPKAKNSLTVARIAQIFSCQVTTLPEEGRAEIEVDLGQDYAQRLGK